MRYECVRGLVLEAEAPGFGTFSGAAELAGAAHAAIGFRSESVRLLGGFGWSTGRHFADPYVDRRGPGSSAGLYAALGVAGRSLDVQVGAQIGQGGVAAVQARAAYSVAFLDVLALVASDDDGWALAPAGHLRVGAAIPLSGPQAQAQHHLEVGLGLLLGSEGEAADEASRAEPCPDDGGCGPLPIEALALFAGYRVSL